MPNAYQGPPYMIYPSYSATTSALTAWTGIKGTPNNGTNKIGTKTDFNNYNWAPVQTLIDRGVQFFDLPRVIEANTPGLGLTLKVLKKALERKKIIVTRYYQSISRQTSPPTAP